MIALLLAALLQDKPAVPDAAAQKKAEALIREIFKDELAKKTPADRVALARKLLAQALQTDDDPASRFVLLREARDTARDASDWETALRANDEIGRRFDTETASAAFAVHVAMGKAAKTPEESAAAARVLLALADDASEAGQWDVAAKAATEASANARKAKLMPLVSKAETKSKQVAERQAWSTKVAKAVETLAKSPDDPDANGTVGRQEGLLKGQWDSAIPRLAKGADPALKSAAAKDLASPADAPARVAAGDAWWDLAEKESESAVKSNLRARAFHWYQSASESATGLLKTKVVQRMEEIRLDRFRGTWVDVTDPTLFGLQGKPGDPITIVTTKGDGRRVVLQKPPKEIDGISLRIRFEKPPGPIAAVWFDSADQAVSVFTPGQTAALITGNPGGSRTIAKRAPVPAKDEFAVVIVLVRGEVVVYLDGEELGRLPAKSAELGVTLQGESGTVIFDRIKIRKRE